MQKFFFCVFLLTISFLAYAQNERELDWQNLKNSTSSTTIGEPVYWGKFTTFQIVNINKFLYKVEISGKQFSLQTPVPSELQTLFRLSSSDLQNTSTSSSSSQAVKQSSEEVNKVMQQVRSSANARAEGDAPGPYETALSELQGLYQDYLNTLKIVADNTLKVKRVRNQLISIAQKDVSSDQINQEVGTVGWPISNIESSYNNLKISYNQVVEKANYAKSKAPDEQAKEFIDGVINRLSTAESLIKQDDLLTIVDDVSYLFTELNNSNNFKVVAPPVQMDADLVSYTIKITPSNTKALAPYRNPINFHFDVPAKGGLKVDFSVGPTISIGSNSKDKLYFLEPSNGNDEVILKQRKNNCI